MPHEVSAAPGAVSVLQANYADPMHARALIEMLDAYACDPAGGGQALSAHARDHLIAELKSRPTAFSVLAFDGAQVVGLANCIEGFSTFACKPVVNVHDLAVAASYRGRRIGEQMLALVQQIARQRGACKLTLEVLSGNQSAIRLYERYGFVSFQLDPAMGQAQFLQMWLD